MARQRRKSFSSKALGAIGSALKWTLEGMWWITKKIFSLLARGAVFIFTKAFHGAKDFASAKRTELSKPQSGASYAPFVEEKKISGELHDFEQELETSKSLIGIIIGSRGIGKSAMGLRILENVRAKGHKVAAMGFSESALPAWIEPVESLDEVKNGTFLLVDEGGILFSARSSFSNPNKLLSELLFISRHKDLSVLFISQNSANLEINTLRQADYLLLRQPSLLQKEFERKIIQKIYDKNEGEFKKFGKHATLAYSNWYNGFVSNELPSFWSDAASKSFKNYHAQEG